MPKSKLKYPEFMMLVATRLDIGHLSDLGYQKVKNIYIYRFIGLGRT